MPNTESTFVVYFKCIKVYLKKTVLAYIINIRLMKCTFEVYLVKMLNLRAHFKSLF